MVRKKIFTRMCLNNWGGISHKILEFHEYVNLFSGKSGSGKSTVMDAIQVILYGSFSSVFLNRAADDTKNRRSVLGYLRGEQKDGSVNREGQDFCSAIVLEIEDTGTHGVVCVGIGFEVRRTDTELKRYTYFSHSGKMPEGGYLNQEGCPFTGRELKALTEQRAVSMDNRGRADVNRVYPSREAYLNTLYDGILGYIDGNRFGVMERNAIALKMTNGTGQFIRDYMFPKSASDTIADISEQLGAYRDIKEKVEDLHRRIGMLSEVKRTGDDLVRTQTDMLQVETVLRYLDIRESRVKIQSWEEEKAGTKEKLLTLQQELVRLKGAWKQADEELMQVNADLKASDLGSRRRYLAELEKRSRMLSESSRQWREILRGLRLWEEDEVVTDYVSNPMLNQITEFGQGAVTEEQCRQLHRRIAEVRDGIEKELESFQEQKRQVSGRLKEMLQLIEDMKNDRKSYSPNLRKARGDLERRLSGKYGRTVHVYILADLFDVREEEWRNAIEGRLARLKVSLITEPQYAAEAADIFRKMKEYEEIDLINSAAVAESRPEAMQHSLYEAVEAKMPYVDACLKRYLGRIIKCHSTEELIQTGNGVTPDCYSYSNFIFRHLKKKDYTTFAFIGSTVSRAKLAEYTEEAEKLQKDYSELIRITERLKAAREFESLNGEPQTLVHLSEADGDLARLMKEKQKLELEIDRLAKGAFRELEEREKSLRKKRDGLQSQQDGCQQEILHQNNYLVRLKTDIASQKQLLEERSQGYAANEELEAGTEKLLAAEKRSGQWLKNRKQNELSELQEQEQRQKEDLNSARNRFVLAYPSCGFSGMEKTNESYDALLEKYQGDYEPKYQEEFQKQCDFVYRSLRGNVIATIHGDIKAAKRHTHDINRLLRKTNFSDSTYQIRIEPAQNENGQFYEMLMAEELDSKNLDNDGFEGQMTLGEDTFYQKYEQKIQLLLEKFMPPREEDGRAAEQHRREMEKYADYRNYLSFSMYEQVTDDHGHVIRENPVDEMAGKDSGGEGQNPKYVALLAGFAMLYMQQSSRDSRIRLVLLDEAFSKMDQERSEVCLKYARKMELQLIVCVPDERLQSLIRNVDCVYGFRRYRNQISMMHIDKGDYLKMLEGDEEDLPERGK